MKKSFPLSKVYGLLEPGPVVLVTTAQKGRANIMTLSWLTMMDFEPPLVGMVMSDRNYSFAALKATKQCVINIPTVELAAKVVGVGNNSGRRLDKFAAFGLTPRPARQVTPPNGCNGFCCTLGGNRLYTSSPHQRGFLIPVHFIRDGSVIVLPSTTKRPLPR